MSSGQLTNMTLEFAVQIVELYKCLCTNKREFVMSKQLLRSGTSIGANINEANYAVSKLDFIAKLHIALKEASETDYWLKLLNLTHFIEGDQYIVLYTKCREIQKMLISSLNTAKQNLNDKK